MKDLRLRRDPQDEDEEMAATATPLETMPTQRSPATSSPISLFLLRRHLPNPEVVQPNRKMRR
jgi:hypothetical protein